MELELSLSAWELGAPVVPESCSWRPKEVSHFYLHVHYDQSLELQVEDEDGEQCAFYGIRWLMFSQWEFSEKGVVQAITTPHTQHMRAPAAGRRSGWDPNRIYSILMMSRIWYLNPHLY